MIRPRWGYLGLFILPAVERSREFPLVLIKHPTHVDTRYLSVDTIEERIDEVLRRKRDLSELILSETGSPEASGLTVHDLFALFKLPPPMRATAA